VRERDYCDADRGSVAASSKKLIALEDAALKLFFTTEYVDGRACC
jgi:hypothetical protein